MQFLINFNLSNLSNLKISFYRRFVLDMNETVKIRGNKGMAEAGNRSSRANAVLCLNLLLLLSSVMNAHGNK